LNDGIGGSKMDEKSIRIIFNGDEAPFKFSAKEGILTIETSKLRGGEQILQLLRRILTGNHCIRNYIISNLKDRQ